MASQLVLLLSLLVIGVAFYSKSANATKIVIKVPEYKLQQYNALLERQINSANITGSSEVANSTIQTLHNPIVAKDVKAKNESIVSMRNISMENRDAGKANIANSQAPETAQFQMKRKLAQSVSTIAIIIVVVSSIGLLVFLAIRTIYIFNRNPEWLVCYKRSDSTSRPEPAVEFQNEAA
ncbi:unnamed protein product [Orchesella dallaii]|uniref:Uncharacterized protein n=1 Tax=Orchesella dallaii TaxID=48710 RepID=A0ABP1RRT7_9HEXA